MLDRREREWNVWMRVDMVSKAGDYFVKLWEMGKR
jgi:hypothetical protein